MSMIASLKTVLAGAGVALLLVAGCARREEDPAAYAAFVRAWTDPDRIARLDTPQTEILSSFDRTGGNNDFNNFLGREGADWGVLADIPGPGVVTRFWTTGGASAAQRLRFYFDGEKTPRIDATVAELRRGEPPFIAELSRYEQSGWYAYTPLPFQRRLRVLAQVENWTHEGFPRFFYQLNYSPLPAGTAVPPLPRAVTPDAVDALRAYAAGQHGRVPPAAAPSRGEASLGPGDAATLLELPGPAVIRALTLTVAGEETEARAARAGLFLRLHWDGRPEASVAVPVDAFFGKLWESPDYSTAFGGCTGRTAICTLPMPVHTSAKVVLENRGGVSVKVAVEAQVEPLAAWRPELGRLHAAWRRTGPELRGQPHPVLHVQGRGKVVGCLLAVSSADPTWWVLESDEHIRIDNETVPGWRGTGLEDYFNGAWYYRNNLARPLHGLAHKRPFLTVQYRYHVHDARMFTHAAEMTFQRGPEQVSPAWMESVGYTYLETPAPAGSDAWDPVVHGRPNDPFERAALMTTLGNYERFGDYVGALMTLAAARRWDPPHPDDDILELREIATRERLSGIDAVRGEYEAFLERTTNAAALAQARLLLWVHEDPAHALLSLQCGNPTRAYLNGRPVAETADPRAFVVTPVTVNAAGNVLALHAARGQYPEWVQAGLRTRTGMIGTHSQWPFSFDPTGNWFGPDVDTSAWGVAGDTLREGPPPAPHVVVQTHAFVDLHALPWGIFIGSSWPATGRSAGFRMAFDRP